MTGTSRGVDDIDEQVTTEVLDEFWQEEVTRTVKGTIRVHKAKRSFGKIGLMHIRSCVETIYKANQKSLRSEFGFDNVDACVNAFYADKSASLIRAVDGGTIKDDKSFDKIVTTAARNWVNGLFSRTESGKKRDMLRQRMNRDPQKRFVSIGRKSPQYTGSSRWGLVNGGKQPTIKPDIVLELAALKYPIDLDYRKIADPMRQREPSYGKKGQLENMLEGIFQAAEGTLTLTELLRIVQSRVSPLQTHHVVSMDANPDYTMDFPDPDAVDPTDFADEQELLQKQRLMEETAQYIESLSGKERDRKIRELAPMLKNLLGDTLNRISGKALS